ncbi:MAG TPA: RMD1 family protein [Sphingobium sp.]
MSTQEPRATAGTTQPIMGLALPGARASSEIRALLLGAQIDMRQLTGFVEAEDLDAGLSGMVFVFRYGVAVFIGTTAQAEQAMLGQLRPAIIEPVGMFEIEVVRVQVSRDADEQVHSDGSILLHEASTERFLLTAIVLARSVILARDELLISEAFERIEPLVRMMRTEGRAGLPARRVMQQIGEVLSTRHRMIGRAQIGEKPDLLWDHPELERLYARLEDEFELDERARAIDRKLDALGDSADILLNLVQERRSTRLELAIIALIMFEIALTLYEKLGG